MTTDTFTASAWRPEAIEGGAEIRLIGAADAAPILPGLDLWDNWPLAHEDGRTAEVNGRQFWFFLSAPCFPDPGQRHDAARLRMASLGADGWRDHGQVIAEDTSPGTREWAGWCCQSNRNLSPIRRASADRAQLQATSDCHSASAAERRSL